MYRIEGYHRPTSVAETVELLGAPRCVALAGGTTMRHDGGAEPVEVVDLQSLGLDSITIDGDAVRVGAMVTLHDLADSDVVPESIRDAAKAELPSTLRTLATVGGTIGAAWPNSLLLTTLLAHETLVHLADERSLPLPSVLADGLADGELVVAIDAQRHGKTATARTGRTPADDPIVAAVGRGGDGAVLLALCGIGDTPRLVDPDDPDDIDGLDAPGDFRGSSPYRRHLARVLSSRVLEALS